MSIFEVIKVIFVAILCVYGVSRLFHYLFPSTSDKIIESFTSLRKKLFSSSPQRKSGKKKQNTIKPNRRVSKPATNQTSKPEENKLSKEEILQQRERVVAEKLKAIEARERKQKECKIKNGSPDQDKKQSLRSTKKGKSNSKITTKSKGENSQNDTLKRCFTRKIHSRIEIEERLYWPHSEFNDVNYSVPSTTQNTRKPKKVCAGKKETKDVTARPGKKDYNVDQTVSPTPECYDDELFFVNYEASQKFKQSDSWSYAVAKFPEYGCIMKPPAHAKFEIRGHKEESFEKTLKNCLPESLHISGEYALPTGENTRPFEPDIAIIYSKENINMFIDIEIDEPYGGITRNAIHDKDNVDDARDLYFLNRGWIVFRFAEIQIHKQPLNCVAYIAKILNEIIPDFKVDQSLLRLADPQRVERWNKIQAEKWARENFRENYLGIRRFQQRDQVKFITAIKKREIDDKIESLVKPSTNHNGNSDASTPKNDRDKRISFEPIPHQYYIDGVPVKSVTAVVGQNFPSFDADLAAAMYLRKRRLPMADKQSVISEWDSKGRLARDQGTKLHLHIEKHFKGETNCADSSLEKELELFEEFLSVHDNLTPVKTEWRIFDERIRIAGTIDFLSKNRDGTFDIYDWKRSKKIVGTTGELLMTNPYQSGFGELRRIDDTSYNRYCLQQGIYKFILEQSYGLKINNMYLVVMHPRYDKYYKVKAEYWDKPVRYILENV